MIPNTTPSQLVNLVIQNCVRQDALWFRKSGPQSLVLESGIQFTHDLSGGHPCTKWGSLVTYVGVTGDLGKYA